MTTHNTPTTWFAISLLLKGCYISSMVTGKPVLIGYRHYNDDTIQGAIDIPERYVARPENIFSEELLKSVFAWAYEIIKKSFPNTNVYNCVISAPTEITSAERKIISLSAIQCGFDWASVRELNIIMAGVYVEQLVGSLNARCLIVCIDGHEISSYVTEIGDKIYEGLAVSRQDLAIDDGEYIHDNIRKSLDLACSSVERDSQISLVDIEYCMVTGVADKHIVELLKERLSGKVSLSTSAILYEPNSIALGSAIISGVMSGEVKDSLLLSILPHSIVIRFENSGLVSSNETEEVSEKFIILIPRNTTIPTKKIEAFSFCMSAGSSILACIDDLVRRKDDLHQYSCIDVFRIDNNGPESMNVQLEITVDVDANCSVDCSFKSVGPGMAGLVSIKRIVASDYLLISDNYHALYPLSCAQRQSHSLESPNSELHAKGNTDKTSVDCSSQVLPYAVECLNRGFAKAELGDHHGAISDYNESIALDPKYHLPYYRRGDSKAELGDHHGAIADYTESIALHPKYYFAYHRRGDAKAEIGDHHGAIADYTESIEHEPKWGLAYKQRGVAKAELGDHHGAIDDYTKSIALDPKNELVYQGRADSKAALGDHQGAIADYTESIALDPKRHVLYYRRGNSKAELGDHQGAIDDYTKCIPLDPKNGLVYHERGVAKAELGDHHGAIADYTESIALDPHWEFSYYQRGVSKFYLGDKGGAIADLSKVIEIDQQYAEAYYLRGGSKHNLGDNEAAISDLNKAIEIDPEHVHAYHIRGAVKNDLGDTQGAISDFNAVIAINPYNAKAFYERGASKYGLGDKHGAITDFNQAIAIDSQYAFAYHYRGTAKHELGDIEGARADYRQAIAFDLELKNPLDEVLELQQPENVLDYLAPLYISSVQARDGHQKSIDVNEEGLIVVRVPPGTREGQKLRIKGKGNYQPGTGKRGDLYLQIIFKDEEEQSPLTLHEVVRRANELPIFDGTLVFSKVLGFIRDENIAAQSESNESKKAVSILSTAGAVGATIVGLAPLGMVLSLGGRFAGTSSNKSKWSPKEIDEIKECFDQSQREVKSITSRFGQPVGRFIRKDGDSFYIYSVFHSGNRGFNMITLNQAWQTAKCFTDDISHVLIENVLAEEHSELYNNLLNSLFPCEIVSIKGIRLVKLEDVKAGDPSSHHLSDIGDAYRFDCKDGSSFFGFKVSIPVHSDF